MAPQWTVRKEDGPVAGEHRIARGKNSPPAVLRGGVFMCLSERRGAEKNIILPKRSLFEVKAREKHCARIRETA